MTVTDTDINTVTPTSSSGGAPRRTVWRRVMADPVHGPLPGLLLGLTLLTESWTRSASSRWVGFSWPT